MIRWLMIIQASTLIESSLNRILFRLFIFEINGNGTTIHERVLELLFVSLGGSSGTESGTRPKGGTSDLPSKEKLGGFFSNGKRHLIPDVVL